MTKMLRFSVCEQTGRTFEVPYDVAIELIQEDNKGDIAKNWNECDIAEELYNFYSDDIAKYEKDNCYFESHVQDEEIYDC